MHHYLNQSFTIFVNLHHSHGAHHAQQSSTRRHYRSCWARKGSIGRVRPQHADFCLINTIPVALHVLRQVIWKGWILRRPSRFHRLLQDTHYRRVIWVEGLDGLGLLGCVREVCIRRNGGAVV